MNVCDQIFKSLDRRLLICRYQIGSGAPEEEASDAEVVGENRDGFAARPHLHLAAGLLEGML